MTLDSQGCAINFLAPGNVVNAAADKDMNPANGADVDVKASVSSKCIGTGAYPGTFTLTIDNGTPVTGTVVADAASPTGASVTFANMKICPANCNGVNVTLRGSITDPSGNMTQNSKTVLVDTVPPNTAILFPGLNLMCGGSLVSSTAVMGTARVATDTDRSMLSITVANNGGAPVSFAPNPATGNDVPVTLPVGTNVLVASVVDKNGNPATSGPCVVNVGSVAVAITAPPNNGVVGASFTLTGTVSVTDSTATLLDGATTLGSQAATGGAFSFPGLTLSNGMHTLTVQALSPTAGTGQATITVRSDTIAPAAPTALTSAKVTRARARLTFTAPADDTGGAVASYEIRYSTAPIDGTNFAAATLVPNSMMPKTPGQSETIDAAPLLPGKSYYFAVVAIDAAGNRSPVTATASALLLDFTRQVLPQPTAGRFDPSANTTMGGIPAVGGVVGAVSAGDVNGDGFDDLLVGDFHSEYGTGAPNTQEGAAYLFLGSASGVGATPDYEFRNITETHSLTGLAVAMADLNGDGHPDIVVGSPFQDGLNGQVSVWFGGAAAFPKPASTVVKALSTANVTFGTTTLSGVGYSVSRADLNNDGVDDLIIGAPFANSFAGAVYVVYGATTWTATNVSLPGSLGVAVQGFSYNFTQSAATSPSYGAYVAGIGDFNADGREDFAVAGQFHDNGTWRVYVFPGLAPASVGPFVKGPSDAVLTLTPAALAPTDVNRLGFGQALAGVAPGLLAVGAPGMAGGAGKVYLVPSSTGTHAIDTVATTTVNEITGTPNAWLGVTIANAAALKKNTLGDVDGDGRPDLVIGTLAPGTSGAHGETLVFSRPAAGFSATLDRSTATMIIQPHSGAAGEAGVYFAGDLNGDSLIDLAIANATRAQLTPSDVECFQ